jgi:two-component system sensor histidine kinase/response regulator
MGFSDLLTRSYDSIEEEKRLEFIQLIKDSSTSAYSLLENLLNWARSQTNKIKFTPSEINLSIIIEENFQMLSVNAQNKKITLIPPSGKELKAFADYNMVNTIIRNLLSNAIKFTPEGGKVSIKISRKKDRLVLSVTDTGRGMSEDDQKKLFKLDEFYSTNGTDGEAGTGLGLIVCRDFVNRHGGELIVESSPSRGSTFTFDLPLSKQPAE